MQERQQCVQSSRQANCAHTTAPTLPAAASSRRSPRRLDGCILPLGSGVWQGLVGQAQADLKEASKRMTAHQGQSQSHNRSHTDVVLLRLRLRLRVGGWVAGWRADWVAGRAGRAPAEAPTEAPAGSPQQSPPAEPPSRDPQLRAPPCPWLLSGWAGRSETCSGAPAGRSGQAGQGRQVRAGQGRQTSTEAEQAHRGRSAVAASADEPSGRARCQLSRAPAGLCASGHTPPGWRPRSAGLPAQRPSSQLPGQQSGAAGRRRWSGQGACCERAPAAAAGGGRGEGRPAKMARVSGSSEAWARAECLPARLPCRSPSQPVVHYMRCNGLLWEVYGCKVRCIAALLSRCCTCAGWLACLPAGS